MIPSLRRLIVAIEEGYAAGTACLSTANTSDEALRYIVERLTEAGVGLADDSAYRCGGSGGIVRDELTTLPV